MSTKKRSHSFVLKSGVDEFQQEPGKGLDMSKRASFSTFDQPTKYIKSEQDRIGAFECLSDDEKVRSSSFNPSEPLTPVHPPSLDLATPTASQSTSPSGISAYEEFNNDTKLSESFDPLFMNSSYHKTSIKETLSTQFDLEILLKHHELNVIEDEIAKIHVMMLKMRQHSVHSSSEKLVNEPTYFTDVYAKYLDTSLNQNRSNTANVHDYTADRKKSVIVADANSTDENSYQAPVTRSKSSLQKEDLDGETIRRSSRRRVETENKPASGKLQCILRRNDGVLVR